MKDNVRKVLDKIVRDVGHDVILHLCFGWIPHPNPIDYEEETNGLLTVHLSAPLADEITTFFKKHGYEQTYSRYETYFAEFKVCKFDGFKLREGDVGRQDNFRITLSNDTILDMYVDNGPDSAPIYLKMNWGKDSLQDAFMDIVRKITPEDIEGYLSERAA